MSGESVVVRRRSRAEIAQLASLYRASRLNRSEFCLRHDLALNTLNRHLKKQLQPQIHPSADRHRALTVLLSNGRRVEVGDDFDDDALWRLVAVLERY